MEEVFAVLTAAVVAFGPLAAGVTKLVDTLRNAFDREDKLPKITWNAAALVVSLLVCILFGLNVVEGLAEQVPALVDVDLSGTLGQVLTAAGVFGFSAYWHEQMDRASSQAKAAKTVG